MTELSLFRVYEPHELGEDGYPRVWHRGLVLEEVFMWGQDEPLDVVVLAVGDEGGDGVKDLVRARAGHRCVRCGHRFVVGESGVMEGPSAAGKAFAAEMGMSQETLDFAFQGYIEDMTEDDLAKAKRTNWSPCDERCTHAGPARARRFEGETGWSEIRFTDEWPTAGEWAARLPEVQAAWRILTVHHLNGRKHDLRWWNLIPVCQRCHLYLQRIVVMERVYPFEHDDYFKPYAAGWYAYAYRGENLTREEAEERQDELLALERMT